MAKTIQVLWTERSLINAKSIKDYLESSFSEKEVKNFEKLLRRFEKNVSTFPHLYPKSQKNPKLRKAVLHKFTSAFYTIDSNRIIIVAIQDNRKEDQN